MKILFVCSSIKNVIKLFLVMPIENEPLVRILIWNLLDYIPYEDDRFFVESDRCATTRQLSIEDELLLSIKGSTVSLNPD